MSDFSLLVGLLQASFGLLIGHYIEGREFEDYLSSKTFFSFSDNVVRENGF